MLCGITDNKEEVLFVKGLLGLVYLLLLAFELVYVIVVFVYLVQLSCFADLFFELGKHFIKIGTLIVLVFLIHPL